MNWSFSLFEVIGTLDIDGGAAIQVLQITVVERMHIAVKTSLDQ